MQYRFKSMQNECSTCKNYAARTRETCKNPVQNGNVPHGVAIQWRRRGSNPRPATSPCKLLRVYSTLWIVGVLAPVDRVHVSLGENRF